MVYKLCVGPTHIMVNGELDGKGNQRWAVPLMTHTLELMNTKSVSSSFGNLPLVLIVN